MEEQAPIDLIHLTGIEGNSVVVRVTGPEMSPTNLVGEIIVDTSFVRGSIKTWLAAPEDLTEWSEALDALADDGWDSISWRKEKKATELHIDFEEFFEDEDDPRATVTVRDRSMSLTTVKVAITLADGWIEDHRARVDKVRQAWPVH
jgi:hypothetical protein